MKTTNKNESVAIQYTVLDGNGHDGDFCGNRYMLISLPNVDLDPAYAIIDEYGNVQTIATDRKTINIAWEELTAISYDNHGLPEALANKLRKTIRYWLSQDLVDYPLNWQTSKMFAVMADCLKPYHQFIMTLRDLHEERLPYVSDMCNEFLRKETIHTEGGMI
jgi:hypothetical protein